MCLFSMRVSIQPQIDQFKDTTKIEVDHHSELSPFAKLHFDFIDMTPATSIPTTIFDDTLGHMKCFRRADKFFEDKWIQYHRENAKLRMLCMKCNRTQPKWRPLAPK